MGCGHERNDGMRGNCTLKYGRALALGGLFDLHLRKWLRGKVIFLGKFLDVRAGGAAGSCVLTDIHERFAQKGGNLLRGAV